ncbi:MAG: ADP-ribosylglycohydrolase family protein [Oscillospiraceae bacterium]|nr:ADP-ribosylglycohydrolase family protein [Oscillospiraceae bacterium]
MKNLRKYRGCLIGGAAGDALGYEVEFMRRRNIIIKFGPEGITDYVLHNGKAIISDDTQMTMFTAQGLLQADSPENYLQEIRISYLDWYQTQQFDFELAGRDSGLMSIRELFHRRAPGLTCMSALSAGAPGTIENPANHSKGCGGVMRTAPIGLVSGLDENQTVLLGAKAAALTHGHELGYIPAGMLSEMIRLIAQENYDIRGAGYTALHTVRKLFFDAEHLQDFARIIEQALELAESTEMPEKAIMRLGEGWVGEEALAIAVYCAAKFEDDFDLCIRNAVNHNGDSDSTGAIAGNILGAKLGLSGIPEKYQKNLECYDTLLALADQLYQKG